MKDSDKNSFSYSNSLIRLGRIITLAFVLTFFYVTNLLAMEYEQAVVASTTELQQSITVSGIVADSNRDPLIGVSIMVKGTNNGTITDGNGRFNITVSGNNAVLTFSFLGFKSQEVSVGTRRSFSIVLEEDNVQLEDVVVVAYGTAKKKDLTGAITSVDTKIIGVQSNSSITRSLEGTVPGLQVASVDGQPGLDMGIRVRGLGTSEQDNANALVVIDGVPMQYNNPLATINSKDIANIIVLKDAASTALYGSRGANGVVLITTKKGASGKAKVSLEARWGVNQAGPNRLKTMDNPKDIYEYVWQMNYNSYRYGVNNGGSANYTNNVQNPNVSHEEAALFASQHLFDYNGSAQFQRNILGNWMLYNVPGAVYTPTNVGNTNESATMSGAYLVNPDGKLNPNAALLYNDSYADELLQNRFRQEYNVSASGGTEKINYMVSLGYLADPSYISTSKFARYSGRSVVDAQVYKWLKVGANVSYAHRTTDSPPNRSGEGRNMGDNRENVFAVMNGQNQLTQLYARDENGNYKYDANGNKLVHQRAGDTWSPLGPTAAPYSTFDILRVMELDLDEQISNDLNTRTYAEIKFLNDFTFTTNLALDKYFLTRTRYRNGELGRAAGVAWFGKENRTTTNLNAQQLLSYNHDFDIHHIDAMVGHEYNEYLWEALYYRSTHELIPGYLGYKNFVGHYTGDRMNEPGGSAEKFAMDSYLARANYIYNDKYYVSASLRRDGSSKFKYNEDRWGTFWSIGGGWRITSEDFMKSTEDWLNNLKIRASYGVIGNQNGIPTYASYQTWNYSANYQSATNGQGTPASYNLSQGGYVNEHLTWENNRTFDAGIDFNLFGRIYGTFDFYNRNNINAFYDNQIPFSLGQNAVKQNVAQIRNRGFEVEIGLDIIKTKDMLWTVSLNGTHYNTIMKKLPEGQGSTSYDGNVLASSTGWSIAGSGAWNPTYLRGTGLPYYNAYLYKYEGPDPNTGLPLYYHKVTDEDHKGGLFTDIPVGGGAKTTNYNMADRYEQGDVIPDWIGGFNTTFTYKNFDFTGVLAYQIGGKFFRRDFMYFHYANELQRDGGVIGLSRELVGNTWTPENTGAKFPIAMYNNGNGLGSGTMVNANGANMTDLALFDASYLSVKNITVGYNLPKEWLSRLGVSNVRIFASGDNLLLFTSHSGLDPRMSLLGGFDVDNYVYPFLRTYNLGINIDF
jgi:TonB-linked SusC/RagA family outer membrane protein